MKIITKLTFATLAAVAVALLFQIQITRADDRGERGDDRGHRGGDRHKLHLSVKFVHNRGLGSTLPAAVGGGFFTWGGTLARPESPDEKIGTFGVFFLRTTPALNPATTPTTEGTETLVHGTLRLPDGMISFTGLLLPEDSVADANGVKSRIGPITGGTGDYWNARGEIDHQTAANGDEEFIITFHGN